MSGIKQLEGQCWSDNYGNTIVMDAWGARFHPGDRRQDFGLNKESLVEFAAAIIAFYGVEAKRDYGFEVVPK